jgi:hypothetical protein
MVTVWLGKHTVTGRPHSKEGSGEGRNGNLVSPFFAARLAKTRTRSIGGIMLSHTGSSNQIVAATARAPRPKMKAITRMNSKTTFITLGSHALKLVSLDYSKFYA